MTHCYIEDLYLEHISENNLVENAAIRTALDAFKQIDGETWYPTVRLVKSDNTSSTPQLIAAVEDHDGEQEIAKGYTYDDENDQLIDLNYEITETSIDSDLILAIVLDPCSFNTIAPPSIMETECPDLLSGFLPGGAGNNGISLVINKMAIRDLKEPSPFRPKISFKGYKIDNPQQNIYYECGENMLASSNCNEYSGKEITTLKRKHEGDTRTYNWRIERSSDLSQEIVYYVIFEYDSFPAEKQESVWSLPVNNSTTSFKFRSWNSTYDKGILSQSSLYSYPSIYGYSVDNTIIKYNLSSN
jgi:hypothetical protein